MSPTPVLTEFAPPAFSNFWNAYLGSSGSETHQQILRSESASNRSHRSIYNLFNEMEDKDGHLFAVLQTRKIGILSRERRIIPASENRQDVEMARFIEHVFDKIPSVEHALYSLLDALAKGFSIIEIMWKIDNNDRVLISDLKSRFQGRFIFDRHGMLRLLDPPEHVKHTTSHNADTKKPYSYKTFPLTIGGVPVPDKKFLRFTFDAQNNNPYGKGLCSRCYWYYWFKKQNRTEDSLPAVCQFSSKSLLSPCGLSLSSLSIDVV